MNGILECGDIKENMNEFCKLLKKADDLVLINSSKECTVRLIVPNKHDRIFYDFDTTENIIQGEIRYSISISRHIIKKLIKPKTEFYFSVYKDAKRNHYHEKFNLHADAVYLVIGDYELLLDTQTCEDNSARMSNAN